MRIYLCFEAAAKRFLVPLNAIYCRSKYKFNTMKSITIAALVAFMLREVEAGTIESQGIVRQADTRRRIRPNNIKRMGGKEILKTGSSIAVSGSSV